MGFALSLVTIGILSTSTLSILNDNYSSPNNIPSDSSTELYSTGMAAGAGATPFTVNRESTAYVATDGYLYGAGNNGYGQLGLGNTTTQTTFVKVGTATTGGASSSGFYQPISYSIAVGSSNGGCSLIVSSEEGYEGKVWSAGTNASGQLGQGDTTTNRSYFMQVSTGTGTYDLPSDYYAVAVSTSNDHTLILTDDGYLYGAGTQSYLGIGTSSTAQTTFTRLDGRATNLPVAGGASGDIVDFTATIYSTYVLYENGDLYCNGSASTSYTKIASNITMFDHDQYTGYAYLYNELTNKIQYHAQNTAAAVDLVTPTGNVVQVRGSRSGGWGYLNSDNVLRLSSSGTSTAPTNSNSTPTGTTFYQISDVSYFDIGSNTSTTMNYGILTTSGVFKIWGSGSYGQLGNGSSAALTYANAYTPTTGGGVDPDYFIVASDLMGLQSTPPATKFFFKKMYFF